MTAPDVLRENLLGLIHQLAETPFESVAHAQEAMEAVVATADSWTYPPEPDERIEELRFVIRETAREMQRSPWLSDATAIARLALLRATDPHTWYALQHGADGGFSESCLEVTILG